MNAQLRLPVLFALGQIYATPGALALLDRNKTSGLGFVLRHVTGDFGTLSEEDVASNWDAIRDGNRVMSAYIVGEEKLWIITEADRRSTTLLLPDEY